MNVMRVLKNNRFFIDVKILRDSALQDGNFLVQENQRYVTGTAITNSSCATATHFFFGVVQALSEKSGKVACTQKKIF